MENKSKMERDMDEVLRTKYTDFAAMYKRCKSILNSAKKQKDEYGIAFAEYYLAESLYRLG